MATPGRSSFAGTQSRPSPSFRDIARSLLPSESREKTFTQAISIAVANFILIFILVTCYAIHVVLLPFLRPLLLALLFGSFLFPLKRSLSLFFRQLIAQVRDDEVPMIAGLLMPFNIINDSLNQIQDYCLHCIKVILSFGTTLLEGDLASILAVATAGISLVIIGGDKAMNILLCISLIIFVTQITKTDVSFSDAYLQFLIRSFGSAQFCWMCPQIIYLLLPIVITWLLIKLIINKVKQHFIDSNSDADNNDYNQKLTNILASTNKTNQQNKQKITAAVRFKDKEHVSYNKLENLSATYNDSHDNIENQDKECKLKSDTNVTYVEEPRTDTEQIYTFYNGCVDFYKACLDLMDSYVDAISTICVIMLVALIVGFTTIYLSFQIYTEAVYLVDRLSGFVNSFVASNPDLKQILPEGITGMQGLLDGAVNNTYQHGREWIIKSTRQLINNAAMDEFNTTQSTLIEKQMVEFWDRAYVLWLNNRNGTNQHDIHMPYDWKRLFDALKTLNFTLCAEIFKQNWQTLVQISDSVTKVLKGNLSLFVGMITALLSFLIVGGNALVNFIINLIIFTTALFNLLCASETQYKPIELIKTYAPASRGPRFNQNRNRSLKDGEVWSYVDESINAVFTASLKIMAFQGLSTWLLHRLFQLEVVYIPSVISMIFGAVPFISPYWASVPAIIDLCWSEHWSQGLLMLLFATLPSSFVISTFYSEIKGAGDPYLTGLAIAGGVFVFGIEGALFGPMLLVSMRLLYLVVSHYTDIYI